MEEVSSPEQQPLIRIYIAGKQHIHYVEEILDVIEESSKARGTGIARRSPEYVAQKMLEGKAIIALCGDDFAGFCYIESWSNKEYVVNSGLIVSQNTEASAWLSASRCSRSPIAVACSLRLNCSVSPAVRLFSRSTMSWVTDR